MRAFRMLAAGAALLVCGTAAAQLEPYKDYDIEEAVWNISTVKVDANMTDVYLEGLRDTWVASNEVAKKLGQIEDYFIMVSDFPQSGDFNIVLGVKFKNDGAAAPSKERYDAFMKEWGKANEERTREIVKTYPDVREITGDYRLRGIKIK